MLVVMFNTVELDKQISVLLGDDQHSNSVLINRGESLIVVDTLYGERDVAKLEEIICCQSVPLRYIVNTHWHSDHIGGNSRLKNMFPEASIIAHKAYLDTISAEEGLISQYPKPDPASYPPPQIIIEDDFEVIPCFMMMNVAGHSADSCIIHIPDKELVICGDVVLSAGVVGGVSVPYYYWGDPHVLIQALEKVRELKPKVIIPGHGWVVKSDILDAHILYLQRMLDAYKECGDFCIAALENEELPAALELENLVDCTRGVHWTFRKMHKLNLLRLQQLAKPNKTI
jgi:cyclase